MQDYWLRIPKKVITIICIIISKSSIYCTQIAIYITNCSSWFSRLIVSENWILNIDFIIIIAWWINSPSSYRTIVFKYYSIKNNLTILNIHCSFLKIRKKSIDYYDWRVLCCIKRLMIILKLHFLELNEGVLSYQWGWFRRSFARNKWNIFELNKRLFRLMNIQCWSIGF